MKTLDRIIKPRIQMVYDESDVQAITGLAPNYQYEKIDFSSARANVTHFRTVDGKRVEKKDVYDLVKAYIIKHEIVKADARISIGIRGEHHFGSEDSDGFSPSVYSLVMTITVR